MPSIKITIDCEVDGKRLGNFPFSRRIQIAEEQAFAYLKATGGGYTAIPASEIAAVQALIFRTDQQLTLRLNGQSDAGMVVNAGGLVALVDVLLNSGVSTNATLINAFGIDANVEGVVVG